MLAADHGGNQRNTLEKEQGRDNNKNKNDQLDQELTSHQ